MSIILLLTRHVGKKSMSEFRLFLLLHIGDEEDDLDLRVSAVVLTYGILLQDGCRSHEVKATHGER